MRILVFCELLRPPFDEGIRNTALQFIRALRREHHVQGLTNMGADVPGEQVQRVEANRLLLSRRLARVIRRFQADLVFYFPTACATPFAFLRGQLLRIYGHAPVVMGILQPRHLPWYGRPAMRLLRPDLCLAPSARLAASLTRLGCRVSPMRLGVDPERFRPADASRRRALRQAYGIAEDAYVVLHVGHIKEGRQIAALAPLQREPGVQVLIVGSAAFGRDRALMEALCAQGVRVIADYLPDIAEVYQLADCYAFPVQAEENAIEIPLSVLEAMACNLPVVSTPYGGLPDLLSEGEGLWYACDAEALRSRILAARGQAVQTRARVLPLAWEYVAAEALARARHALSL